MAGATRWGIAGVRLQSSILKLREGPVVPKNPTDLHVGKLLRQRRWLLGLTQQQLAQAVGIRFQQVQKYESGANRISASRLWDLSKALKVPVTYFFEGLEGVPETDGELPPMATFSAAVGEKETHDMLRAYLTLAEGPRRRLLDLAQAMNEMNGQPAQAHI
jgi:transcriptional regulator with XRE-family HTH domain